MDSDYTPSNYPYTSAPQNTGGSTESGYNTEAEGYYQQAGQVGPDGYTIETPGTDVATREVGEKELAGYQLEGLLDRDSELSRRAIQFGEDRAAGRGLMNTTLGGASAYGSWVDAAQPFALDQAGAYQRTASENMAATNVGSLQDSQQRFEANVREVGYDAARDIAEREHLYGASTDLRRAALNVEDREDAQSFSASERAAIQAFQRGERLDTQNWTDDQRRAVENWQTSERIGSQDWEAFQRVDTQKWQTGERLGAQDWEDLQRAAGEDFNMRLAQMDEAIRYAGISQADREAYLQAWSMVEMGKFNSIGAAGSAIYSNTDLTAAQQQQAIQNMIGFFEGITPDIPSSYGAGSAPLMGGEPPADTATPIDTPPPPSIPAPVISPVNGDRTGGRRTQRQDMEFDFGLT
jgi:hypothetical protein